MQPKTIINRLKTAFNRSIQFITCREKNSNINQKEKFFRREVLYHLLKIIGQCENIHLKLANTNKVEKNAIKKLIGNSKDYFKNLLNRLLLYLLSTDQARDDQLFALNLFFEKTNEFIYIDLFIDKNDGQFLKFLDLFLSQIKNEDVNDEYKDNTKNVNYFVDEFKFAFISHHIDHIYAKFSEYSLLKLKNSTKSTYQTIVIDWNEQLNEAKIRYENDILQSSTKLFSNMLDIFKKVFDLVSFLNDKIILAQQSEQKHHILHLQQEQIKNDNIKKRLYKLIGQLLHEKNCWFLPEYYPESWELSPFESNGRICKKMERCFLEIDNRYIKNGHQKKLRSKPLFGAFLENGRNICHNIAIMESNIEINDESMIPFTSLASIILYDEQIEGEVLLKRKSLQFMANVDNRNDNVLSFNSKKAFYQNFLIDFNEIKEITKCRYELQNRALEIVLISGLTYLIAFKTNESRDECFRYLISNRDLLPNLVDGINLLTLTQMWRERRISNFDYLMQLNKLSGRSFNDLMQYPVFPFVLSDYSSDVLNLLDGSSFRDLSRPIAVQKKEREKYYIDQYNYIKAENNQAKDKDKNDINSFQFIVTAAPYHYGAHYSNSGIVLYYLVRLPPYTQMFLQYQDKNFDLPDRSFHSLQTTWGLATENSTNGFKELIPEFFYLPEFLKNNENFNLGTRQNGEQVDNVILPAWCNNDARLFTLINLQALESNYVTQHINNWFDLIFGFKQTGKAAVDAVNVFHPATHFTADLSKIEDDVKRHALKTMIKTFGQMPTQLFNLPHPAILTETALPIEDNRPIGPTSLSAHKVIGLKWGNYVGSPIHNIPVVCFKKKFPLNIEILLALPTNDILLLPSYSSPLVVYNQPKNIFINTSYLLFYSLCIWSPNDTAIWFRNQEERCLFTTENSFLDKVC